MKVKSVYIFDIDGKISTQAAVNVPGLGEVSIKDCLSTETVERVYAETVAALQVKFGQTLKS